jgi:hypothetical protein
MLLHKKSSMCGAILAIASGLIGCRSNQLPPSQWPASDFRLHVEERRAEPGADKLAAFRVWSDGIVLYSEAESVLSGFPQGLPVYHRLAIYRLDPHSLRALCRDLQRSGLFEAGPARMTNAPTPGQGTSERAITIRWVAHADSGMVSELSHDRSLLERAVFAIAGFLPPGVRFMNLDSPIERISDAPAPRTAGREAVLQLRELARSRADDLDLLLDLFAAAVGAKDWVVAREALAQLEHDAPPPGAATDETLDWRRDALPLLRAMLPSE